MVVEDRVLMVVEDRLLMVVEDRVLMVVEDRVLMVVVTVLVFNALSEKTAPVQYAGNVNSLCVHMGR